MNRRDFLKFSGIGSLGLFIGGVKDGEAEIKSKDDMPRVSNIKHNEDFEKAHIVGVATETVYVGGLVKVQLAGRANVRIKK